MLKPATLDKIIELNQRRIEELLLEKFKIETDIEKLEDALTATEDEFENEKNFAQANLEFAFSIGTLIPVFKNKINRYQQKIEQASERLKNKIDELAEQYQELKKYEKIKEKIEKETLDFIAKKEQKELDELAIRATYND